MTDKHLLEVMSLLLRRTRVGELRWEEMDDNRETFLATFDAGVIRLRETEELDWDDQHRETIVVPQVEVRVIDRHGKRVIDRRIDGPQPHLGIGEAVPSREYRHASALLGAARETARGADELLRALIEEVRERPPAVRTAA